MKDKYRQLNSSLDDSRSEISSLSTASISKYIFDGGAKVNTIFHSLKSKETKSVKFKKDQSSKNLNNNNKNAKFTYQKKNGLFIIPEEEEYVPYIKDYEPLDPKFSLKNLIRSPHFKVLKS